MCVTDPASNGVGGDAFILIYDAKAGKVLSINGGGPAPRLATIEWYRKNNNGKLPIDESLLAGTVPGTVDLWYTMLDRWGTMTFAEVLRPAIELAEKGFPIGERLARGISKVEKLKKYPTTAKIYHPNGKALAPGEVFRNPGLARTLQRLVEAEAGKSSAGRREGLKAARDRFYKGDIAREMAAFSEANGGLFRYDDFASYQVKIEEPVSYRYRGYDVYKNPSANQGPSEPFTLSILAGFDLKAMGHNSAEYIHVNVEAIKLAFADREKFLADQDFVSIPFRTLLSPEYVAERRGLVNLRRATSRLQPGSPEKFDSSLEPVHRTIEAAGSGGDHKGDTSYIAVVDSKRNAVSWTPSLHSSWGTGVVMGELGFSLNCRGDYFWLDENHANSLQTGKRSRSTLTPTLVLKNGKPFMAVGSPGGDDQCMRILQTFLNVVEFGMNVQAAIEAPRWSTESFPHPCSRMARRSSILRSRSASPSRFASNCGSAGTRSKSTAPGRWAPPWRSSSIRKPESSAPAPIPAGTIMLWPGEPGGCARLANGRSKKAGRPFVMLNPVATQTLIPIEEYLRTAYEPDAEFVDGEIVERNLGEDPHSAVQVRLVEIFYELRKKHRVYYRTELRVRLAPARIRIPDFAVFQDKPTELVPSTPPLVIAEIVSREDRHTEIVQKFEEYRAWGVPHIWLADPWQQQLSVYGDNGLTAVGSLQLGGLGLTITPTDIFD